jgi:hypothetical protein
MSTYLHCISQPILILPWIYHSVYLEVSDEQLSVNQVEASDGAGEWSLASKTGLG